MPGIRTAIRQPPEVIRTPTHYTGRAPTFIRLPGPPPPDHEARSGRFESRRAGLQGGPGGGDVVDDEDRSAREIGSLPYKRAAHVLLAPQAVMADLGRGRTGPDELTRGSLQGHARPELRGEELRLVESASPLSLWMKGHGHGPRSGQAFHHEPLHQQNRQRRGQATPALVLE